MVAHFIFIFAGNIDLNTPPANWKLVLFAVSFFLYQHLDNLDGKQARKTSIAINI